MAKELVLIETDSCVSCYGLEQEIQSILPEFDSLEFHIARSAQEAQPYLNLCSIDQLPALLLIDDNEVLGHLSGYQPAFILEVWLQTLLKEGI